MYSVTLKEVADEFDLINITEDIDLSEIEIDTPQVNRPALQLAGFFDYFDSDRIQLIGIVEYTYLCKLTPEFRQETLEKLFQYKMPCVILARDLEPLPEMMFYAKEQGIPILKTDETTSEFMGELLKWLKVRLAERTTIHGVLVDIYGEGVLIMGESGIGKSEAALELVKRGHRLVADDAVEIKKVSHSTLVGSCPELIRYFIEVRGIGIINVKQMFGVQSVKDTQEIDLIIKLEYWEKGKEYDRLGLKENYMDILGNKVVCHAIPVRPGRNIAIICESAAVNRREKKMGYNAAQALNDAIMNQAMNGNK
ncbi:MAG TPA: HPr(Ser) kinase/phosphatase [Lachnospiraceae bacterium]|nr:HPr(Ser) kinase/phosphatase [Lachnospiraceae bacterium]